MKEALQRGRSSPGRVQPQQRKTPAKQALSAREPALRTLQMGVRDQVQSFVAWMLEGDVVPARLTDKRTVQNYLRWAEEWNVVPIPASILLHQLKDADAFPQVRFKRERILDAEGRALRNENGTPLRASFYTFAEKHTAKRKPKLPGKVPVTDLVAHEPLRTRPKATAQPVETQQPLPFQEAA